MFKLIIIVYVAFILNLFGIVDNKGIKIDLVRQKTPWQNALNTPNIKEYGLYLDWLKPHPHPHNLTNITIALRRFFDNEFYGELKLGSKNQSFNVIFDTAWSTSWVLSSKCSLRDNIGCWFHTTYDHVLSQTYQKDGRPYHVNEGSYNLSGFYSIDNIDVSGIKIKNFSFVEMENVHYTYIFSKASGVIGLALPTPNQKSKSLLTRLLEDGIIKTPIFSLYLNRDRTSTRGGAVMLGAYDSKHIHKDPHRVPEKFQYVSVLDNGSGLWQFSMDAVAVDLNKHKSIPVCTTGCKAIIDSSCNAIIGTKKEIDIIVTQTRAKYFAFGRYTVDCDQVNRLPHVTFIINGQPFTLSGKQYVQKFVYMQFQICISAFMVADSPSETSWVLGGAFLSHYFSVYDLKLRQIGFVRAA